MSGRLMLQALRVARTEEGNPTCALASAVNLLMLLLLADMANKAGICWHSIKKLSSASRLSPRSVRYAIRALGTDGHITVEKRPGRNDRYHIHPGKRCHGTVAAGATPNPPAGEPRQEMPQPRQQVPRTVARGATEPYKEPYKEPCEGARSGSLDGQRAPELAHMTDQEIVEMQRVGPLAYWAARGSEERPEPAPAPDEAGDEPAPVITQHEEEGD